MGLCISVSIGIHGLRLPSGTVQMLGRRSGSTNVANGNFEMVAPGSLVALTLNMGSRVEPTG